MAFLVLDVFCRSRESTGPLWPPDPDARVKDWAREPDDGHCLANKHERRERQPKT